MKPSNELFNLIKSLSKSEKRFFKLFSSLQAGEKNYFKLFNYIDKQEEYNEPELKEHFKKEKFIKHLPSEKNHLYKQVLKSLRQFHGDVSIANILSQEIKNIEILYDKALFKEAKKFLNRAKKIAHEHEEFYYLTDLIAWEKVLTVESYEAGIFDVNLNEIIKEEAEVIEKLRNQAEYHILYSRINAVIRNGYFVKSEENRKIVDEIANNHLVKGKNTALSSRAASICYYIQGLCAVTNRDFKTSYLKFNRVREILDKNPKIKIDLAQRYILTLFHLTQSYSYEKNFDMAHENIDLIASLKGKKGFKSLQMTLRINNILLTDRMSLYNKQGKFEKAYKVYQGNYEANKELIQRSSKEHQIKFYYTTAYTLFAMRDYKEALRFINIILNDNEQNLRQDIYSFARILDLLLHFELANYSYIEYSSSSALRYLNKNEPTHQIELVFIKQIRKIAKSATQLTIIPIFEKTLEQVETLLQNENERIILDYIDIVSWTKSKIIGEDFLQVAKKSV